MIEDIDRIVTGAIDKAYRHGVLDGMTLIEDWLRKQLTIKDGEVCPVDAHQVVNGIVSTRERLRSAL